MELPPQPEGSKVQRTYSILGTKHTRCYASRINPEKLLQSGGTLYRVWLMSLEVPPAAGT